MPAVSGLMRMSVAQSAVVIFLGEVPMEVVVVVAQRRVQRCVHVCTGLTVFKCQC